MKQYKPVTFFEGVLAAVIFSLIGSVLFFTFAALFPEQFAINLLISGLSFSYLLYLLKRSQEKLGRLSVMALWFVITIAVWLLSVPLLAFLSIQLILIWLVRSIYFYSSLLSAIADLALTSLSLATAIWALSHTTSLFLSLWCFFLTQALFVLIPRSLTPASRHPQNKVDSEASFQHSYRAAEAAVTKLSNQL